MNEVFCLLITTTHKDSVHTTVVEFDSRVQAEHAFENILHHNHSSSFTSHYQQTVIRLYNKSSHLKNGEKEWAK